MLAALDGAGYLTIDLLLHMGIVAGVRADRKRKGANLQPATRSRDIEPLGRELRLTLAAREVLECHNCTPALRW
jgi:hypothetical protein